MSQITVTLLGAAGEVTGSAYLVQTARSALLVDLGMFQGGPAEAARNRLPREINPRRLDAVLLTHAHIDHTGRLPLLVRRGYRGPIYATPATIELSRLLLEDAARIQADDLERTNRRRERAGLAPQEALFRPIDVERTIDLMRPLPYDAPLAVGADVSLRAYDSGHLLGSVSLELTVAAERPRVVVFSGDIGPRGSPILRDPARLSRADLLFLESTYGDRDHRSLEATEAELAELVARAAERRGKILVPAFSVGRSQQILYYMAGLFRSGAVEPFPIYLDSPMAIKATEIYLRHPELADAEAQDLRGQLRRDLPGFQATETPAESRALNDLRGPCMIIAGAGMCNAGRILHHLRQNLWRPETAVLIVGYQAHGTLGRQLVDGARRVSIFGEPVAVRASVHSLGGLSAHAGQSELLDWLAPLAEGRPQVALTHGEDPARAALARRIAERFGLDALLPVYGERVVL